MELFDKKSKKYLLRYVFQSLLAIVSIFGALLFLNIKYQTAIIIAWGASTFIVFVTPYKKSASPRCLIGGYIMGIISGMICKFLLSPMFLNFLSQKGSSIVSASISVGLAIFLMVITDTGHPPAASVSLGLVLNRWNHFTIIIILGGITLLSIAREVFKSFMIDLKKD